MKYPHKIIVKRDVNEAIFARLQKIGYSELTSRILSGRTTEPKAEKLINARLNDIQKISDIIDINKAGKRIVEAVENKENIGLLCDFDVDGTSSAAIMYKALTEYLGAQQNRVTIFISNRLKEGYGFSEGVLKRVLGSEKNYTLLITADQGSSDEDRIKKYKKSMKSRGLSGDVIISDHHEIPENNWPKSSFAFVNPVREDSEFKDKTICGASVSLFLMMAALQYKKSRGGDIKNIVAEMDYCTAATISDCVDLSKITNRAIVNTGLSLINKQTKPAWVSIKSLQWNAIEPIKAENIAFGLGPRINACSRVGMDGLAAVKFFLSETNDEAERYLNILTVHNDKRKKEEKRMLKIALNEANSQHNRGLSVLVIRLDDGNHGIHGIVASRIVERFGKPTIMFSPKEEGVYSGSARSILGVDIRSLIQAVADESKYIIGYGGHKAAAGLSIKEDKIEEFADAINRIVGGKYETSKFVPMIDIDGSLPNKIDFLVIDDILRLEPYGRGFEYPKFSGKVDIIDAKFIGKDKNTAKLKVRHNGQVIDAIWFNIEKEDKTKIKIDEQIEGIFEIRDRYNGNRREMCLTVSYIK